MIGSSGGGDGRAASPDRRGPLSIVLTTFLTTLSGVVANVAPLPSFLSGVWRWIVLVLLCALLSLLEMTTREIGSGRVRAVLDRLRPLGAPAALAMVLMLVIHVSRTTTDRLRDLGLGVLAATVLSDLVVVAVTGIVWSAFGRMTRRGLPRTRAFTAVTGLVTLLAVVVGLTGWRLLEPPQDHCGRAVIAVDGGFSLKTDVQRSLKSYQQETVKGRHPDGRRVHCSQALRVDGPGRPLRDRLKQNTPITAVITADPENITGLNGIWKNLEVGAAPPDRWRVLGLRQATVLDDTQGATATEELSVSALRGRSGLVPDPADAATLSLLRALDGPPATTQVSTMTRVSRPPTPVSTLTTQVCGPRRDQRDLIFAGGWEPHCPRPTTYRTLKIKDDDGNTVGAPVLGIPLTGSRHSTAGPTHQAVTAAENFLTWLGEKHQELGLENLTETPDAVLHHETQLKDLNGRLENPSGRSDKRQPIHVTVVLDASLSMGRLSGGQSLSPWASASGGLLRRLHSPPTDPQDTWSVIVARRRDASSPPQVYDPPDRRDLESLQSQAPQEETGLPTALHDAERHQGHHQVTVLITDGVNVFTENGPLPSTLLSQVDLVLIGHSCTGVPRNLSRRSCRTVVSLPEAVAEQLTTLGRTARDPSSPGQAG